MTHTTLYAIHTVLLLKLAGFQNQIKISKIVQNVATGDDADATGLKQQIDEYIKEIDRCIAQLSES